MNDWAFVKHLGGTDEHRASAEGLSTLYRTASQFFQPYLYGLIRAIDARLVVETGVNIGISTYFALHALAVFGGTLCSCDPMWQTRSAALGRFTLVGWTPPTNARWVFSKERSCHALPRFPKTPWDIFVHDSDHSRENMLWEMRYAWPQLRPGGIMVVDDYLDNDATDVVLAQYRDDIESVGVIGQTAVAIVKKGPQS